MPGPVFLRGDNLNLRIVEEEDIGFVHEHEHLPEVRRGFGWRPPRTRAGWRELLQAEDSYQFLVCRDGEPVGAAWLFRVDEVDRQAELGYWVVPDEQGKGYATEAAELLVRFAFSERGLHKVVARVLEGNDASRRVLEKLGFQREASLREHHFVGGRFVDTELLGLLSPHEGGNHPGPH